METKYYGINNAIMDERFKDASFITDLIINNRENLLNSYCKPALIYDNEKRECYYPKKVELDNNLYLEMIGIYEYGTVYNIYNTDVINTKGTFIVGSNNASFFIDSIDDKYNDDVLLMLDLEKNIKKEKVFMKVLGKKYEIEKAYGVRTNNRFLRTLEQIQSAKELKIIEIAIENAINVLKNIQKEDTKEFKKILRKI